MLQHSQPVSSLKKAGHVITMTAFHSGAKNPGYCSYWKCFIGVFFHIFHILQLYACNIQQSQTWSEILFYFSNFFYLIATCPSFVYFVYFSAFLVYLPDCGPISVYLPSFSFFF